MIFSVLKNSPADVAGLKEGDTILSMESGATKIDFPTTDEIKNVIASARGIIKIDYKRGSATNTADMAAVSGIIGSGKAIGISMGMVGMVKFGFFKSFYEGLKLTSLETVNITKGIWSFIIGIFSGKGDILSQAQG